MADRLRLHLCVSLAVSTEGTVLLLHFDTAFALMCKLAEGIRLVWLARLSLNTQGEKESWRMLGMV